MKRRAVLAGLMLAAVARGSAAQTSAIPTVGFISSRSQADADYVIEAFRRGLAETGFVEGKNVQLTFRWADGHYERLPALAAELVAAKVRVILAGGGSPTAVAAKAATTTVPIVFASANNPVELGLVASLARPGGNVTGMSNFASGLGPKSVELMKEVLPSARTIAYLVNPANPNAEIVTRGAVERSTAQGIHALILNATTDSEIDSVFASLASQRADGVIVYGDPFFDSRRERIVALAAQHRIPACHPWREYALAGGLMSYGASLTDSYRRAGLYVGRILKGETPADLPVEQPAKFELIINVKAAKQLGISFPAALFARADEVIE
jgi:putative tryptophan/tyrosine transport system substrate-binding protein